MKKLNGLEEDALNLLKIIDDSLPENKRWLIINLAKSKKRRFDLEHPYHMFPQCFGYSLDMVPELLISEGVILASNNILWFLSSYEDSSGSDSNEKGAILEIGKKHGFFTNSTRLNFYTSIVRGVADFGPRMPGHIAALIDVKKMKKFIEKRSIYGDYKADIGAVIKDNGRYLFQNSKTINFSDGKAGDLFDYLIRENNREVSYEEIKTKLGIEKNEVKNAAKQIKSRLDSEGLGNNVHVFSKGEGGYWMVINFQQKILVKEQ